MPKLSISLAQIMSDPNMSISSSPFAEGKTIIKRASFRKGVVPAHLRSYLIKAGECKGQIGKVVHKGKVIPKAAACVAAKHGR